MTDLYSDYSNNKGNPQLDRDYWQNQKNKSEKTETYNLFDTLIKTNFDIQLPSNFLLHGAMDS